MKRLLFTLILVLVSSVFTTSSNAELFDRGSGLIYDDILNITWFDNEDLASDGTKTWSDAVAWADQLEVQGYNNWRLPYTDTNCSGYNCINSEMGHLFYNYNINSDSFGLFSDVRPYIYWSATELGSDTGKAWRFNFSAKSGYQGTSSKTTTKWAWAVRDGDSVSVAPEPVGTVLFLTGGAMFAARRYWTR